MTDTLPPSESAGIARKSCLSGCTLACLYYGSILLLILALPVWWFCIYAPPLVISEATTRITGPLTADGQIDFFKALEERIYPPEMKTDDNGFRDLVRLFGFVRRDDTDGIRSGLTSMTPEEREFYRLQKYEKLGLDSDVPPKLVFPDDPLKVFMDFYESKGEPIPADVVRISPGCCGRTDRTVLPNSWLNPWTLEQFPMFADWLKEIEEPMNAIAEAVRKPVFVVPILQNCNALDLSRQTRLILQARAMYRLGNGDIDGAIDDGSICQL